jgi:two-component system, OmpR family, phosphate regulon sensor histidine kinase PhoR
MRPSDDRWPTILRLVAHQLRTPTSLIAGYAEMLASDEVQGDPRLRNRILREVNQNLRELNRLAIELQDATRVQTVGLPIQKAPILLGSLIDDALKAAAPLCASRNVHLESNPLAAGGHVVGDRFYLRLCLVNLIDNAAKYGKPGGRIRLAMRPAGPLIEMRVADDGMGLGPDADELFAPFVQGANSTEGIGLGLTLVSAIVAAHGGSMTWKSGRGSYVGFTIPWSPN